MNERIRLLAKEAGLVRCGDWGMERWEGPRYDSVGDQDLEKFSELIVKECAELFDKNEQSELGYRIGDRIYKHFEIK